MLKKILIGAITFLVLGTLVLTALLYRMAVESRTMEVASGHENGRLLPCPESPNCVSSQAPAGGSHYISPIDDPDGSKWRGLADKLAGLGGVELVSAESNYAHYTFQTKIMGFVDDVEFYKVPDRSVIHVRSASRVGQGDLNANRDRVEKIRTVL